MRHVITGLICCLLLTGGMAAAQTLRVHPYVSGLTQPVGLVPHPTDPTLQYVIEKAGRIRVVERGVLRPEIFLDIVALVRSTEGERGLLGLAFDPDYATNRRFWINYTRQPDGHTVIARYQRHISSPYAADPTTRHDLLFFTDPDLRYIPQPQQNHNGGKLLFGPDGYLYVAMGDGGTAYDPDGYAQDRTSLLGKILRIDPRVPDPGSAPPGQEEPAWRGYRVPPDNPFVSTPGTRSEIWAFGLRNPWRVSFDDPRLGGNGAMFIADVGQSSFEEVSYQPPGAGGRNYGWPLFEGPIPASSPPWPFDFDVAPASDPLIPPITYYDSRGDLGRSITGGYRYRGRLLGPAMYGRYIFGDILNRVHHVAVQVNPTTAEAEASDLQSWLTVLPAPPGLLVSIDADLHGELFLVYMGAPQTPEGTIFRLTTSNDVDGNGLDDTWEALFDLPALGMEQGGPYGDANGDGIINAEAFRRGLHPTGQPVAYFAEGATGFFNTRVSVLNDEDTPTAAVTHFQTADGREGTHTLALGARRVGVADAAAQGLASAEFATRVLGTRPHVAARTMTWQTGAMPHGSHSERALASPGPVWHFAEGATTFFELFYLVQNASATDEAVVQVEYFVRGQGRVVSGLTVPPGARRTVWVNQEPGLSSAELGATFTATNAIPIVVERAMYTRGGPQVFPAGHASAGEQALATRWFFAEGATGAYFDTFLAVANPHDDPLEVEFRVFLPDGLTAAGPLRFHKTVGPRERLTVWLDQEEAEDVALADWGALSVEVVAAQPFMAERAMWWPGDFTTWHEGHGAAGFSEAPAAAWRVAGGEVHMPPAGDPPVDTYVLVSNIGPADEPITVTVYFTDREPLEVPMVIPGGSRGTLALSNVLAGVIAPDTRVDVGVRVDAASQAAQLYVEQAVYGTSPGGPRWARGSAHRADR